MPTKRPLLRLRDIVENGQAILGYAGELDFKGYTTTPIVKDACERCFSRLSEAAVKLGPRAEELFPSHNWRGIRDFGNVLRHDYPDVHDRMLWAAISTYLPTLIAELEAFLAEYPDDQETL